MPEPEEITQIIAAERAAEEARADRIAEIEREAQKQMHFLRDTVENDVARRRIVSAQSTIAKSIGHTQYAMQSLRPLELRESAIIARAEKEAGEDSGILLDADISIHMLTLAGVQAELDALAARLWQVLNKLS
jgi:hypothetical protein